MASSLTISVEFLDFPEGIRVGCLASTDGVTELCALVRLHEPLSVAGVSTVAKQLVRTWFEPELFSSAEDALRDYLTAAGERLL